MKCFFLTLWLMLHPCSCFVLSYSLYVSILGQFQMCWKEIVQFPEFYPGSQIVSTGHLIAVHIMKQVWYKLVLGLESESHCTSTRSHGGDALNRFLLKNLGVKWTRKKPLYMCIDSGLIGRYCTFNITTASLYYHVSRRPSCCIFELILWQLPMKAALIFPWNIHQPIIAWSSIIQTPSDKLVYFICMVVTLIANMCSTKRRFL